jgi:hypothetical protein
MAPLLFVCGPCGRRFEAKGRRVEWASSLYGPCHEYVADCPSCGKPAKEYRAKPSHAGHSEDGCGEDACAPSGGMGGCNGCPCAG